jgi:hypothetical protein
MAAAFGSVVEAAVLRGRGSASNLLYPRPSATGTLPVAAASGAGRNPTTYVGVELLPSIENATGAPRLEPAPKNTGEPGGAQDVCYGFISLYYARVGRQLDWLFVPRNSAPPKCRCGGYSSGRRHQCLDQLFDIQNSYVANVLGVTAQASLSLTASPSVGDFPTNTLLPKSTETLGSISTGLTATPLATIVNTLTSTATQPISVSSSTVTLTPMAVSTTPVSVDVTPTPNPQVASATPSATSPIAYRARLCQLETPFPTETAIALPRHRSPPRHRCRPRRRFQPRHRFPRGHRFQPPLGRHYPARLLTRLRLWCLVARYGAMNYTAWSTT